MKHRIYLPEETRFKIEGVYCRLIPLTKGLWAIVWESDYHELIKFVWYASWNKSLRAYYAARRIRKPNGDKNGPIILMHRQLLSVELDSSTDVDHKEPFNPADNRRSNLRRATRQENSRNAKRSRANTSGFKGVSWDDGVKKWRASMTVDYKSVYLGIRNTPEEAYALYCEAATKRFGEFARLA